MAHTILLVDDEDSVRAALRRALKGDGYTILEATSGADGLDKLKKNEVDIVISDHEMPVMKGLDFLRNARIVKPGTLRILLTGQADLNMAVRAVNEDGVYRFLLKPWNNHEMKVMISLAVRHLDAERENARLLDIVRRQAVAAQAERKERKSDVYTVERDERGAIIVSDAELEHLDS